MNNDLQMNGFDSGFAFKVAPGIQHERQLPCLLSECQSGFRSCFQRGKICFCYVQVKIRAEVKDKVGA
jgi:hypothetical protein